MKLKFLKEFVHNEICIRDTMIITRRDNRPKSRSAPWRMLSPLRTGPHILSETSGYESDHSDSSNESTRKLKMSRKNLVSDTNAPLYESCAPHRLPPEEHQRFSRPWKSSDLILQVEDREFHVHRAVLMVCSPVFEAMLSSEFKEKSAKKIPLPGKDATEIEQLLQGIYPNEDLWISKENCLFLLKLSTEYQIDRLKTRCEEYLSYWRRDGMNIDEAVEVIIISQKYSVEKWIVERCVDQFVSRTDKKWVQLQKHKRFSELEPSTVKLITEERVDYLERRLNVGVTMSMTAMTAMPPQSISVLAPTTNCRRCKSVDDIRNNFRV